MTFVTHLESALDGTRLPAFTVQTTHADRPLWVRYDLDAIRRALPRDALRDRAPDLWRYRELLPIDATTTPVSLGETMTPLLGCPRLARAASACASCSSRTSRRCRPARSRRAVWRWR